MKPWLRELTLVAVLVLSGCADAPPEVTPPTRQLPEDVLRGLNTDAAVIECFSRPGSAEIALRAQWWEVRRQDLNADGAPDWIVQARESCLRGEHGRVWVYEEHSAGRRLVLRADATTLSPADGRRHGYVDLTAAGSGGARRYAYDGTAYVAVTATASAQGGTEALPADLHGEWSALSKVYFDVETLRVSRSGVDWGDCGALRFEVLDSGQSSVLLGVASSPPCLLFGEALRYVSLKPGRTACKLEVTLYATQDAARAEQPSTWGVFEKANCEGTR